MRLLENKQPDILLSNKPMESNLEIPFLRIYLIDILAQVEKDQHTMFFISYWKPKCPSKEMTKSRVANSWPDHYVAVFTGQNENSDLLI